MGHRGTEYVRELMNCWPDSDDWRAAEEALYAWRQFTTQIDGTRIHFLHVLPRGQRSAAEANHTITTWTDVDWGGHFAALEEPAVLIDSSNSSSRHFANTDPARPGLISNAARIQRPSWQRPNSTALLS